MLRQKVSYSSHTSPEQSPSPSPIPGSRSSSSASNHHNHHSLFHETTSASGVRRAFTQLQNALHPSRNNHQQHQFFPSSETRHTNGMPVQSDFGGYHHNYHTSNGNGAISNDRLRPQYSNKYNGDLSPANALAHSTYSAHSNGTTDSFYSSSSTMSPLTTDDDNSSITSQSRQPQRPRQMNKASSLPSPLGTYPLGNGSTEHSPAQPNRQGTMGARQLSAPTVSNASNKSGTESGTKAPLQLRVRNFERSAANTGYLTKFSSRTFFSRKQWKRRYFVLTHKSLHCFKSADPQHPLLESLPLTAETIVCVTDIFSGKRYCLQITSPNEKEWFVLADTAAEMAVWLRALKGTVLQYRNRQIDSSRPPGGDLASAAADVLRPYSPALTSDSASIAPRSSSPPPRPPHPSQFYADLYPSPSSMTNPSLSPPPRAMISKPPTPIPGSRPQEYDQEQTQGTRRRTNSTTIASAHSPSDYASFSTVMERADASPFDERHRSTLPSSANTAHVYGRRSSVIDMYDDHDGDYSYDNGTVVSRTNSNGNGSVSGGSLYSRRTSLSDRPDSGATTLPRRSSQRMMGSPSRPLSSVSRPLSPSQMNRSSPRNSLVIAPPPRSVHRPLSVSVRHSTQVLPSQNGSDTVASHHPRPLSPTPEDNLDMSEGALSRITSIRHNRDLPVRQRHVSLGHSGESVASFRSPSRSSTMPDYMTSQPDRPLSPAPTLPLPDVPSQGGPGSGSPNTRASLTHSISNGSGRRIQIVPRHHDPEILSAHRPSNPKPRTRCQSQESALMSMAHDTQFSVRANGTTTPSPRLGAVATQSVSNYGQDSAPASPSMNPSRTSLLMSKHISLPLNSRLVLPAPPSTQQPDIPVGATITSSVLSISSTNSATTSPSSSRPTSTHQAHHNHHPPQHRYSTSTSSMSSQSSLGSFAAGITTASLGGPVPRKNHNSARDSSLSSRLSCLAPLPPGAATSVPSPPTSALPPIPGSVVEVEIVKSTDVLVEEEEEEEEEQEEKAEVVDVATLIPLPPSPPPSDRDQAAEEVEQVVTLETSVETASDKKTEITLDDKEVAPEAEQMVLDFNLVLEEEEESIQDSTEMAAVHDTQAEKTLVKETLIAVSNMEEKEKLDINVVQELEQTRVIDISA